MSYEDFFTSEKQPQQGLLKPHEVSVNFSVVAYDGKSKFFIQLKYSSVKHCQLKPSWLFLSVI